MSVGIGNRRLYLATGGVIMRLMAKKRQPDEQRKNAKRESVAYIGLPNDLRDLVALYARSRSTLDDEKSQAWALRVAVRKFFVDLGWLSPDGRRLVGDDPPPRESPGS